jgi:hypothetical protein
MANHQRYELRRYGVICEECSFDAIVTIGRGPSRHYSEEPDDRWQHCTHAAADTMLATECPHWKSARSAGRRLDDDGNLMHEG